MMLSGDADDGRPITNRLRLTMSARVSSLALLGSIVRHRQNRNIEIKKQAQRTSDISSYWLWLCAQFTEDPICKLRATGRVLRRTMLCTITNMMVQMVLVGATQSSHHGTGCLIDARNVTTGRSRLLDIPK